jgi:glutamine amidotransferase
VISYLGTPLPLHILLYDSDSSLVRQAYDPRIMAVLNLAGFGLAAWNSTQAPKAAPLLYKDPGLPMFDRNLMSVARAFCGDCVVAHVRGANYLDAGAAQVGRANLHPFQFPGSDLALAHNGGLARFPEMKFDLLPHIRPEFAARIEGTTDSEWIYAVLRSQIDGPDDNLSAREISDAVVATLRIIRGVRHKRGIKIASGTNLFVTDGRSMVTTRFSYDFGCYEGRISPSDLIFHSLWYTAGRNYGNHDGEWKMVGAVQDADSILIASEPLTRDTSTWIEIPEYTILTVSRADGRIRIHADDLDV